MTDRNTQPLPPSDADGQTPAQQPPPAPSHGFWWRLWLIIEVIQARLRFFVILALIGLVVGFWDTLVGYYEKWTRPLRGQEEVASADTEYFCPMHPFIVRDNRKE